MIEDFYETDHSNEDEQKASIRFERRKNQQSGASNENSNPFVTAREYDKGIKS